MKTILVSAGRHDENSNVKCIVRILLQANSYSHLILDPAFTSCDDALHGRPMRSRALIIYGESFHKHPRAWFTCTWLPPFYCKNCRRIMQEMAQHLVFVSLTHIVKHFATLSQNVINRAASSDFGDHCSRALLTRC